MKRLQDVWVEDDKETLQGEWVVAPYEIAGQKEQNLVGNKAVLKGGRVDSAPQQRARYKIKIGRATKNPKEIDFVFERWETGNIPRDLQDRGGHFHILPVRREKRAAHGVQGGARATFSWSWKRTPPLTPPPPAELAGFR